MPIPKRSDEWEVVWKPYEPPIPAEGKGEYDDLIEESCWWARKSKAFETAARVFSADALEYTKGKHDDNAAVVSVFNDVVDSLNRLSKKYQAVSDEIWVSFEKSAISKNDDDKPFVDLLGAVYRTMVEEYRECVETICNRKKKVEEKDKIMRDFLYLDKYFKGSQVYPILQAEIREPDFLERYVQSYL